MEERVWRRTDLSTPRIARFASVDDATTPVLRLVVVPSVRRAEVTLPAYRAERVEEKLDQVEGL
jgi:hypothetical protein